MYDKFKDECGVFGVFGHTEAAHLTYLGLHALQHRGQESAGIVAAEGGVLKGHRGLGLVADVFDAKTLSSLPGPTAMGHVRYSTAGGAGLQNAQPFLVECSVGSIAVAHNGNLVNAVELRHRLHQSGAIFQSTSDTEVLVHLIARAAGSRIEDRLMETLGQIEGAYALLFMSSDALIGVRDPLGFRPLVLGRLKDAYVLSSETCALDLIEAEYVREIDPGEMVIIDKTGIRSIRLAPPSEKRAQCVFEHIYFARPDSVLFGKSVYDVRQKLGQALAREHPVVADVVIPIPDSGTPAAIGFSNHSGVPFGFGLVRSHYIGRTFIEPQQSIRNFGVKLKLSAVASQVKNRRLVVVDDSLVRGTTSRKIVTMLRAAGAHEVHLRISSPPTRWPCYYGIDTPTRKELIASSQSFEEIARFVGADTLGYLSLESVMEVVGGERSFCHACFSGNYLVPLSARDRVKLDELPA